MKKFGARIIILFSLSLLSAFPWIDNTFRLVETGSENEIRRAIETDYSFKDHTRSSEKENLLMAALKNNRGNAVIDMILKQAEISPDSKTKSGVTAFMYACQYETDMDAIKTMLYPGASSDAKKAARILAKDKNGLTSFDYARKNPTYSEEVLGLLGLFAVEPVRGTPAEKESPQIEEEKTEPPPEEALPASPKEPPLPAPTEEEITEETENSPQEEIGKPSEENEPTASGERSLIDLNAVPAPSVLPESVYLYDYAANTVLPVPIPASLIAAEEAERAFIADANKTDSNGRTKLMKAAKKGDIPLIENLLFSGAEIDAKDDDGWTALMYAARFQKDADVTRLLLFKGADRSLKNKYGLSALVLASGYSESADVISALLETCAADSDTAREALSYGISNCNKAEVLQAFVDKGVPLNVPFEGKTPLMVACETNKNTKIIEWLLKNGAEKQQIEAATGKTAFDYAKGNRKLPHNVIYWSLNPNS